MCHIYDVKIVISSTWRLFFTLNEFQRFFSHFFNFYLPDLKEKKELVIGLTPKLNSERGKEILTFIKEWNKNSPKEPIEKFVSVDDDGVYDVTNIVGKERSIEINSKIGLGIKDILEIIEKLKLIK